MKHHGLYESHSQPEWKKRWPQKTTFIRVTCRLYVFFCVSTAVVRLCSHAEQVFSCTTVSLFNWKRVSTLHSVSTPLSGTNRAFSWYYTLWVKQWYLFCWYRSFFLQEFLFVDLTAGWYVHETLLLVEQEDSLFQAAHSWCAPPFALRPTLYIFPIFPSRC